MTRYLAIFVAALVVVLGAHHFTQGASTGPAGVQILSLTGKKPAIFNHTAHVERAQGNCRICHHKDAPGTGSKCMTCHTEPAKAGIPGGRQAFHECIKCHAPGTGPIYPKDCMTCHVRPGV
ncbi:MAG: cytochrome c3 family protein [Deltaproteobacteria bacterium]|nr:cytochrome c3 family protein [Deltaproteobacteria bacterium]